MINDAVIKLDDKTVKLLHEHANIVYSANGGYKFYFLPFWFGETDDREHFTVNHLESLPKELSDAIKSMRGKISDEDTTLIEYNNAISLKLFDELTPREQRERLKIIDVVKKMIKPLP
jgi:hypothetical protein